ncbi:MAG: hypothetical protein ACOYD0_05015 [Candidatus Nanopelagicales bacterium]
MENRRARGAVEHVPAGLPGPCVVRVARLGEHEVECGTAAGEAVAQRTIVGQARRVAGRGGVSDQRGDPPPDTGTAPG